MCIQQAENAMNMINDANHAVMVASYIQAMQWASTDLDDNSLEDYELSDEAHQAACVACTNFLDMHGNDLDVVLSIHPSYTYDQAGHDLFLTREGHGAGFWDRDLGHYGDVFTKYCNGIGACSPYVGDDQLIYMGE